MNGYTRDIAALLKIDLETAERVQDHIEELDLLDWSECTQREFNQAAREAYADLGPMTTDVATLERIVTVTSLTGETWSIEGKEFASRKPKGMREGHDETLACIHRDVSVCDECVKKYANLVEVGGQHYWVRDYAEWSELVKELVTVAAQYA